VLVARVLDAELALVAVRVLAGGVCRDGRFAGVVVGVFDLRLLRVPLGVLLRDLAGHLDLAVLVFLAGDAGGGLAGGVLPVLVLRVALRLALGLEPALDRAVFRDAGARRE